MVVKRSARHLRRERFAQIGEIGRAARRQLGHDNAWDRQVTQRDARTKPRLDELCGFLPGIGAHVGNAWGLAHDGRRRRNIRVQIAPGHGANLDRHLAPYLRLPVACRAGDQQGRAGGQRRKERHDGHDRGQRSPGY
jgi:hypothetical protein